MNSKNLAVIVYSSITSIVCNALAQDAPVTAIEIDIEVANDRYITPTPKWIDKDTLLFTNPVEIIYRKQYSPQLSLLNVRTGKTLEILQHSAINCTNPENKIVGALIENTSKNGERFIPQLFKWDSEKQKITTTTNNNEWNTNICKQTDPEYSNLPGESIFSQGTVLFTHKEVHLEFSDRHKGPISSVTLFKEKKPFKKIDARQYEVHSDAEYTSFSNEYTLSKGMFTSGRFQGYEDKPTSEFPLVTMTKSGEVKRHLIKEFLDSKNIKYQDGTTLPFALGTIVSIFASQESGGGIYLKKENSFKRIWCTNTGGGSSRECRATSLSVSPDGCHLAFLSKTSDDLKKMPSSLPTIKVLPLCK